MREIAAILGIGVFVVNFTWRQLEGRFSPYAVWYMLQGIWVSVLCLVIVSLLLDKEKSRARNLAVCASTIGAIEGLKVAFFRFLVTDASLIPKGVDVCDYVTGLPVQSVLVSLYALFISWTLYASTSRPA